MLGQVPTKHLEFIFITIDKLGREPMSSIHLLPIFYLIFSFFTSVVVCQDIFVGGFIAVIIVPVICFCIIFWAVVAFLICYLRRQKQNKGATSSHAVTVEPVETTTTTVQTTQEPYYQNTFYPAQPPAYDPSQGQPAYYDPNVPPPPQYYTTQ